MTLRCAFLFAVAACGGMGLCLLPLLGPGCTTRERAAIAAASIADTVVPVIIREIPHDTLAFTQGLLLYDGRLIESTGAPPGRTSSLRVVSRDSGTVLWQTAVPGVFAEGIAILGAELVQLTWKHQFAIRYRLPSLTPLSGHLYYDGEGWGLASDGRRFYMSNGSDTIVVRNQSFGVVRTLPVRLDGRPLRLLNELVYARNHLYANIWYSAFIAEIDPHHGAVRRIIDCAKLFERVGPMPVENVLNGIAYDEATELFYLTGKNWPLLFEVRIAPRDQKKS